MTRPHYVNGRVLLRPAGGVRRYASEVVSHLERCSVLAPRSADHPWSARLWEQTTLARSSRDGVLLSMANGGPLNHTRHIVVVHDLFPLTMPSSVRRSFAALTRVQLPAVVRRSAAVVTHSRQVADEVGARFDLPPSRVHVVAPGISDVFGPGDRIGARTALGLDADRPVVAALVDPAPRKNSRAVIDVLIEITARHPRVQAVVAGRARPAAFAAATAAPDRSALVDLGELDDPRLATMYRAADVFLALSTGEGFGLPVVEAARSGAAVVSTPVPSLLEHTSTGAVLVAGTRDAVDAIAMLLDEPNRQAELVAQAARDLGDLQWSSTAATLEALMTTVGRS